MKKKRDSSKSGLPGPPSTRPVQQQTQQQPQRSPLALSRGESTLETHPDPPAVTVPFTFFFLLSPPPPHSKSRGGAHMATVDARAPRPPFPPSYLTLAAIPRVPSLLLFPSSASPLQGGSASRLLATASSGTRTPWLATQGARCRPDTFVRPPRHPREPQRAAGSILLQGEPKTASTTSSSSSTSSSSPPADLHPHRFWPSPSASRQSRRTACLW